MEFLCGRFRWSEQVFEHRACLVGYDEVGQLQVIRKGGQDVSGKDGPGPEQKTVLADGE